MPPGRARPGSSLPLASIFPSALGADVLSLISFPDAALSLVELDTPDRQPPSPAFGLLSLLGQGVRVLGLGCAHGLISGRRPQPPSPPSAAPPMVLVLRPGSPMAAHCVLVDVVAIAVAVELALLLFTPARAQVLASLLSSSAAPCIPVHRSGCVAKQYAEAAPSAWTSPGPMHRQPRLVLMFVVG